MVREHRQLIRAKIFRRFEMAGDYRVGYFDLESAVGARNGFFVISQTFSAAELAVGSLSISLGDVVLFIFTIWLAFALSRLIRFVLEEDIYPRVDLAAACRMRSRRCFIMFFWSSVLCWRLPRSALI